MGFILLGTGTGVHSWKNFATVPES